MSNIEITPNTVFLCWFQGLDHLLKHGPPVNQTSWNLWNKLNPGNILLITDKNLGHYAPETEKLRYFGPGAMTLGVVLVWLSGMR